LKGHLFAPASDGMPEIPDVVNWMGINCRDYIAGLQTGLPGRFRRVNLKGENASVAF
jgi:hypothetical protein